MKEKDDDEVEVFENLKDQNEKEDGVTQNIIPLPRPPVPFPQRFVKKEEKY